MQNFNPQAQGQPTIQRDSYLFIEFGKTPETSIITRKIIEPEDVRDNGIGAVVARHVQSLVKKGFEVFNVYVGSLL